MASDATLALLANDVAASTGKVSSLWMGGRGTFLVEAGTWGGGSVKLQFKSPNGTYIDVPSASVSSANGMVNFELPPGELKAVATTATGVYAYAIGTRVD